MAALLLLSRVVAIYTQNVHWDEFALLQNAASTAASGELHAGGRPGLAVLLLLPVVSECGDEMFAVHAARLLWLGFTLALACGLAALVLQMSASRSGTACSTRFSRASSPLRNSRRRSGTTTGTGQDDKSIRWRTLAQSFPVMTTVG